MAQLAKTKNPTELINVATVIRCMSDELKSLSARTEQLQVTLSAVTTDTDNSNALNGLQALDEVTQSLNNLSRISNAIAPEIPYELRIDAKAILEHVTLDALVNRMNGPQPPNAETTEQAGELELF